MMKGKGCSFCGSDLIKFGSNISCSNLNCNNAYNDEEAIFVKYYDYGDVQDLDVHILSSNVSNEYKEDYDEFLYFSDRSDYISRFEYRKMNDFIEEDIFKGNKIDISKRFLKHEEIEYFGDVDEKHDYLKKGRDLEHESHQSALKFYKSLLNNRLFRNDYYIYKKMVIFEKDPKKQLEHIVSFFKSGIYCNRYHYLFFLKRLYLLSNKINVSDDCIDYCLRKFKNHGFKMKESQDVPVPIAEKITLNHGVLKVKTDEEYSLMQFKYEMMEESSNLIYKKQFEYSNRILESLILDKGFKDANIFKEICRNYHSLGDYQNELKWIFGFFSKGNKYNSNYWYFLARLDELNIKTNKFCHNELFFDTNEYYLTKQDFKDNSLKYRDLTDYIFLIKSKYSMLKKGRELEKINPYDAIDYYESIIGHEFFVNDYYVYKRLADMYHQIDDLESELETILSFLNSGIYCDYYNYLFFIFNLRKLSHVFIVEDQEIDDALKSFKEISFKNKHLENTPAPLSERILFRKNELKIMPYGEFINQQEVQGLELELDLYGSCGMLDKVNEILKTMIGNHNFNDVEIYKQICYNYRELNDVEAELDIIRTYLKNDDCWNFQDQNWFKKRLHELENKKSNQKPMKVMQYELFYENNVNYLNYDDFKNNDGELTEFIDKSYLKCKIRQKGWKLENIDYKKAIDYYNSLLDHYLFKDDYYIYRKLVIFYEKLNEFELVWQTIKSFFNSGINCTRYQYIWFLHKLKDVSDFMFISNEEVNECLKNFKENGFQNKDIEKEVFLCERLYMKYSDLKVVSHDSYNTTQKKYELEQQARQLELNGDERKAVEILRNLIENGCNTSKKDYMRLCFMYRRLGDYENELEVINKYLSRPHVTSRDWFEKRLNQVNQL